MRCGHGSGCRAMEDEQLKHFIGDRDRIVQQAISGILASSHGRLTRLDGYPEIKVLLRAGWDGSKVSVISGGGSGHEPAHAGFVGEGMLTAAVCGDIFASPSVDAVLSAIIATTGPSGCLLIVKNYTGDRLNFGLAATQARALGYKVEVVVVGDDVATSATKQPRGVAGTLFVHKIAGYLASQGETLTTVANVAGDVAASIMTIGMAIETCSVPGRGKEQRLAADEAELGLGIHGEPGVQRLKFASVEALVDTAAVQLSNKLSTSSARHALLVNNLGGATPLEMSIVMDALTKTPLFQKIDYVVGPAPLMTALDMKGFSLSLLPLDDQVLPALLAPCEGAWPAPSRAGSPVLTPMPKLPAANWTHSSNPAAEALVRQACAVFIENEDYLNALDAKVGDGDTGSTFATAARGVLGRFDGLPFGDVAALLAAISQILSRTMGGSSGILLAILLSAASKSSSDGHGPVRALRDGLLEMQRFGGAQKGDRTMIDALSPALDIFVAGGNLEDAAKAARKGADSTREMGYATAGRSSYLAEGDLLGNVDPGAEAAARLFERLVERSTPERG